MDAPPPTPTDVAAPELEGADLLRAVATALRTARWNGADVVDRGWASPLPAPQPVQVAPPAPRPVAQPVTSAPAHLPPRPPASSLPARAPAVARATGPIGRVTAPIAPTPTLPPSRPGAASAPQTTVRSPRLSLVEAQAALDALRTRIGDCQRCSHASGRTHIVHGYGNPAARLMIVTPPPGPAEDAARLLLQGEAGQLVDRMLTAMGLQRSDLWIAPLTLCRVPGDGPADAVALEACSRFLRTQLQTVQPEVLLAFGEPVARFLFRSAAPIGALRGQWQTLVGVSTIATHAPEDVLRRPELKREVWGDLQQVMQRLALVPPGAPRS
ncbi:MAG: uracil-DNA glycosylase family protein [Myxococcota bacterium]